jgi:hypothetical protein
MTTHVGLLGGVERRGRWAPGARVLHVALLGGADLDCTEAERPETTLVAVSVVGGVHVTVPPDVRVVVSGLRRANEPGLPGAEGERVLRVRSFTILGGVKVDRAAG